MDGTLTSSADPNLRVLLNQARRMVVDGFTDLRDTELQVQYQELQRMHQRLYAALARANALFQLIPRPVLHIDHVGAILEAN